MFNLLFSVIISIFRWRLGTSKVETTLRYRTDADEWGFIAIDIYVSRIVAYWIRWDACSLAATCGAIFLFFHNCRFLHTLRLTPSSDMSRYTPSIVARSRTRNDQNWGTCEWSSVYATCQRAVLRRISEDRSEKQCLFLDELSTVQCIYCLLHRPGW